MSRLLEIRDRIRTIRNLRKVTGAMELVTRTKIGRVRARAKTVGAHHHNLRELYLSAVRDLPPKKRDTRMVYVIIVLSQKGFCGSFDDRVLRYCNEVVSRFDSSVPVRGIVVGRPTVKTGMYLKFPVVPIEAPERFSAEELLMLSIYVSGEALTSPGLDVFLVYNELVSAMEQTPVALQLYPFPGSVGDHPDIHEADAPPVSDGDANREIIREPGTVELYRKLVPAYLHAALEHAYWESLAGENCARLVSMKGANDNAEKILDGLKVEYNKTRQAKITQELAEIVSAFDVLSGRSEDREPFEQ